MTSIERATSSADKKTYGRGCQTAIAIELAEIISGAQAL